MGNKPSRGEQLYEQTHHQRLRLIRLGFILQILGFLLPIGVGLLLFRHFYVWMGKTAVNIIHPIVIMLCGGALVAGSIMVSELREPKLPKNKYRPVKKFYGAYRRKGELPTLVGTFYIIYGLIRLISAIGG
jgi:hypothetical protein